MSECSFRDHEWKPSVENGPGTQRVTMACWRCGVGHRVDYLQETSGRVRVALTVFPARGSTTIDRQVVRWSFLTHAANIDDIRRSGMEVVEDTSTLEGTPVGD